MSNAMLCKYPNLAKLIHYHTYSYYTFASHAGITESLLEKILAGEADIHWLEVWRISKLFGDKWSHEVPFTVLMCEKPVLLSKDRYRHRMMMEELQKRFDAVRDDSGYSKRAENRVKILLDTFQERPVYYTAYLATLHDVQRIELSQAVKNIKYRNE